MFNTTELDSFFYHDFDLWISQLSIALHFMEFGQLFLLDMSLEIVQKPNISNA